MWKNLFSCGSIKESPPAYQPTNEKTTICPQPLASKKILSVPPIFLAEPKETTDVSWYDNAGGLFLVHSAFLAHHSKLLCDMLGVSNQIASAYDKRTCLLFFHLLYEEDIKSVTANASMANVLSLWQLTANYGMSFTNQCAWHVADTYIKRMATEDTLMDVMVCAQETKNEEIMQRTADRLAHLPNNFSGTSLHRLNDHSKDILICTLMHQYGRPKHF